MALTVSKIPRGILSLLGIQNFGQSPRAMADAYTPTLDMIDAFLASEATVVNQAVTPGGTNGFYSCYTVPDNQVLVLQAGGALAEMAAGFACNVTFAMRYNTGAGFVTSLAPQVAVAATQQNRSVRMGPVLWLPPGTQLGGYLSGVTGGVLGAPSEVRVELFGALLRAGS